MSKFIPAGFDSARIIDGIHKAMGFGEPNQVDDKATFYKFTTSSASPKDGEEVPFDPAATRTRTPVPIQVSCAVEYSDTADQGDTYGVRRPSQVTITLLDAEYQQVKGFEYVVCGGDQYFYRSTEPPVALGSIDVWTVHARSLDEG